MKYKLLEIVALRNAMPEHGLKAGDTGTIVDFWRSGAMEVEFIKSGRTVALLTLKPSDVRPLEKSGTSG
jgi:hypothetical protein